MIKIQDWVAAIPAEEKHIAYVGEGMAETRDFFVTGGDWERYKDWSFHLDLAFDLSTVTSWDSRQVVQTRVDSTEDVTETQVKTSATTTKESFTVEEEQVNWEPATDIASLAKTVEEDGIRLTWTILRQHTQLPGKLLATLRAVGTTFAQVKKSAMMVFEVEPAVEASPAVVLPASEFEEMEARMDALCEQTRQQAVAAGEDATAARDAAETAAVHELEAKGHAGDAATKALLAADSAATAEQAAQEAGLAANSAESAMEAAQTAADAAQYHYNAAANAATGARDYKQTAEAAAAAAAESARRAEEAAAAGVPGGGSITVDAELSETSENPVQNKVLTAVFNQATGTMEMISSRLGAKQDTLVSGKNIKTVNGQSLLGEGNIDIEGGGASITVDDTFNPESTNPVQNKVITAVMNEAQTTLTALAKQTTPAVTTADNGKVLAVVNGVWTAVSIPSAEGASF